MKTLHIGKSVDLPVSIVTAKAAVLAMTGMGKTYLAKAIAEEMMKAGAQIVVVDYTGVWWGLQSSASGKRAGFPIVIFGGDHGNVALNEQSGALIADTVVNERISAVLDLSGFEHDSEKIRFLNAFARRLYYVNKRPIHVFIDEADEFVPQNPGKEQVHLLSAIKRIWQRGRVKGIGGTLISQRSALVNKSLLSQSEILIALRTVGPQDRAALKAWFDSWGTKEQIARFEDSISNLPKHSAWFWSPQHDLFVVSKARPLETFDSSATPDATADLVEPERRADIDVAKLGKQIEKLAEEAKANDPAELKKQFLKATHVAFEAQKQVKELEERLKKREAKPIPAKLATLKVPEIWPAKTQKQVEQLLDRIEKHRQAMNAAGESVLGRLAQSIRDINTAAHAFKSSMQLPALPVPQPSKSATLTVPESFGNWQKPDRATVSSNGHRKMPKSGGVRNLLITLATHGPTKYGKAKSLAGIAKPHTMTTYVGRLIRSGDITREGDMIRITNKGRAELGAFEPLPAGRDLIAYWQNEIGSGGMGKIFEIVAGWPGANGINAEALQQRAGIQSNHTFVTYLGRLRRLEVIEVDGDLVRLEEGLREAAQL